MRNLMVFLAEYDLSPRLSMMVYKRFGNRSIGVITENPYILSCEPFYADFPQVDYMALSMGFSADDTRRIEGGILYEMTFNQNEGHVFLPFDLLANATATLLSLPIDTVDVVLEHMAARGAIMRETVDGYDACYTKPMYDAELFVASRMAFLACAILSAQRFAAKNRQAGKRVWNFIRRKAARGDFERRFPAGHRSYRRPGHRQDHHDKGNARYI